MTRWLMIALLLAAAAHAAPVMVVDSDTVEYLDGWQLDANGWLDTSVMTFADTYYVSESIGNDSYDGTSGTVDGGGVGPKATIAAGLALLTNGEADRLLLKRGDDWASGGLVTTSITGGASKTAPMLLGAYGSGAKPIVYYLNFGAAEETGKLVVQDLHLVWSASGFSGNQVWENVWFGGTSDEADVNGMLYVGHGTVVMRCVFDWHRDTGDHSTQGMYFGGNGLRMRQCYFWGNQDFERPVEWTNQTANQHAIYSQTTATDVEIDNSVVWELTDNGIYIRGHGTITDCLAYRTYAGAGSIGHNWIWETWPDGVTGLSARNVNLQSLMIFNNSATSGMVVEDNIVVGPLAEYGMQTEWHSRGGVFTDNIVYQAQFRLTAGTNYTMSGNILWRDDTDGAPGWARSLLQSVEGASWSNTTFAPSGDTWIYYMSNPYTTTAAWEAVSGATGSVSSSPSFVDPTRGMQSYLEDVYGQGDIYADEEEAWDGFLTLVRAQDRDNWDTALEAEAINAHIRAGFEVE